MPGTGHFLLCYLLMSMFAVLVGLEYPKNFGRHVPERQFPLFQLAICLLR